MVLQSPQIILSLDSPQRYHLYVMAAPVDLCLIQNSDVALLSNRKRRLEILLLLLLGAAAFLVRIWGISKCHYWDEWVYLQNAQVICCGKVNYSELAYRPPLLSLIFAGVFLLWRNLYAACIVTALLNALGPVFLYLAGRRAVGRLPAAIAALLLGFAPFFVGVFPEGFVSDDTGNSLLTDSPALTLVTLAFWLLLRALGRESARRFALAGVALALAILMRFGSLPGVGLLFLLPLAAQRRGKALAACGLGLAATMAPYLLWSRLEYGGFFTTLRGGWTGVEGETEPVFFFLRNAPVLFTWAAVAGVVAAAAFSLWRLVRAWPWRLRFLQASSACRLQAFLWIWLLAGLAFFSIMPHKEPRYILPVAPPILLLAGQGLALVRALPHKTLRSVATLLAGVWLLIDLLPIRERFSQSFVNPSVPDEETASTFINTHLPAGTELYMSFNYPAFAFYTNCPIHELSDFSNLYRQMDAIPPGGVLVIYRQADIPAQSDVAWVNANPNFELLHDFSTLAVYRRVGRAGKKD
jgi:hypothetical protein